MLVSVQIISKVLATQDYSLIGDNLLDDSYFEGYEKEFNFIKEHYDKFNNVPDEISFLDRFPDFELVEVTESNQYLLDTIREQHLYLNFVPIFQHTADLLKTDSNEALEYLLNKVKTDLSPSYSFNDTEIVESVNERVKESEYVNQNPNVNFIPTGFEEIDRDITGLQKGDEYVVIVARINQGKSWVLEKICTTAVESGLKVGYFDPEMSASQIGYRFDTLHGNVPNSSVLFGKFNSEYSLDDYKSYAEELNRLTGKLYVTKPKDFARRLTVSKLRNWAISRSLDMIAIDGITYLTDERFKKGDSKTISLTNISEDLMDLSAELRIPILVVVQANRGGIVEKTSLDTPELENIKDSDGIAANASRVYSVRQVKDKYDKTILIIENKKSRTGEVGQKYKYEWSINTGEFVYKDDIQMPEGDKIRRSSGEKKEYTSGNKKAKKSEEDEF